MRRIEDIGREARRGLGVPGPGPSDGAFLTALATARSKRRRRSYAIAAGIALAAFLATVGAWPRRTPGPAPLPVPTARIEEPAPAPATLRSDPVAALLLEGARLRLDGFGDRAVARTRLREVIEDFPGTGSALEAARLLEKLDRRDG